MHFPLNQKSIALAAEALLGLDKLLSHESIDAAVESAEQSLEGIHVFLQGGLKNLLQNARNAITTLLGYCTTNSGNSSMPPSVDGNATAIREKKKEAAQKHNPNPLKKKRKPGGQPGHKGTTLQIPDKPDRIEQILPENLPKGGDYVFEPVVTFHDVEIKFTREVVAYVYMRATDRNTGKVYEPEIRDQHLVPCRNEILEDIPGALIAAGTEAVAKAATETATEARTEAGPEVGNEARNEGNPKGQTEICLKRRKKSHTTEQHDRRRRMKRRRAPGYGPSVKAMAVNLNVGNFVPGLRAARFCAGLGCNVSEGSIYNWVSEATLRLIDLGYPALLCQGLLSANVLHLDETFMKFDKKRNYIHVWADERWALYHFSPNRGRVAHEEVGFHDSTMGLLKPFLDCYNGTMVHDALSCYFSYEANEHALCHAHVERELEKFAQMNLWRWPKNFLNFFHRVYHAVEAAGGALSDEAFRPTLRWYKNLLTKAFHEMAECAGAKKAFELDKVFKKADALRARLEKRWREYLLWAIREDVPYTNNLAERFLRMMKVREKVSNCFRNLEFARDWCLVRSYIQTTSNFGYVDSREPLEMLFRGELPKCLTMAVADLPPLPANFEVVYVG